MPRIQSVVLLLLLLCSAAVTAGDAWAAAADAKRPNIILLVADDQRRDMLGATGNPIVKTPRIDALAAEGMIFDRAFVTTSICATSRASIFTGQWARRHGVSDFQRKFTDAALAETYPALLKAAGYRTGFIGKWGVGRPVPGLFDYDRGFPGQGHYFVEQDGKTVHLTNLMGDQALEFLDGCGAEQPFCLSVSFKAPHVQDEDPRQYLYDPALESLYADVTIPMPPTCDESYWRALPEFVRESLGRVRWHFCFDTPEKFQASVKGYYRLLTGIDLVVGRIRQRLREMNAAGNTVIIYTSDNGYFLGERGLAHKWFMYEESIAIPLIVYDPRLPGAKRGQRDEHMVLNVDIAPTILDYAGVAIPQRMQGRSLRPLVEGRATPWRSEFFYEHRLPRDDIPQSEGIRTERWAYIRYVEREPLVEELFDLAADPTEKHNLAADPAHAATLAAMRAKWEKHRHELH